MIDGPNVSQTRLSVGKKSKSLPPTLYFLFDARKPPRKPKVIETSWLPTLITKSELFWIQSKRR